MAARHEFHACDGVRVPFDTACALLDRHRNEILRTATRLAAGRLDDGTALPWDRAEPQVVTAPLQRDGERSATMAMHWVQPGEQAGGELSELTAWLHAQLRLLPRRSGGEDVTELLLTTRCETSPQVPGAYGSEFCGGFLHAVADGIVRAVTEGIERQAASEPVPR